MKIHGVKQEWSKLFVALALLLVLSTTACSVQTRQDQVLASIGKCESGQIFTHGEFQDYTDFGVYTFSAINFKDNAYFSAVGEDDIEMIESFIDDFEKWIDTIKSDDPNDELVLNYSFDRSVVDTDDSKSTDTSALLPCSFLCRRKPIGAQITAL